MFDSLKYDKNVETIIIENIILKSFKLSSINLELLNKRLLILIQTENLLYLDNCHQGKSKNQKYQMLLVKIKSIDR